MSASWKTVHVFISSTFRDMQAERDWLVRFVFPRLREELAIRRIRLIDVDLRWGVTGSENVLDVCQEVIDQCRPRFLCILGGRYGWIPPGHDSSITASEVRYAVLDRSLESSYAFFYFRDPEVTAAINEAAAGDFREPVGTIGEQKLTELKQAIIEAGFTPYIYSARWDAAKRRIVDLGSFGNRVFEDLLRSLRDDPQLTDRFRDYTGAQADEFEQETSGMDTFVEGRVEAIVLGSRESLIETLVDFAENTVVPNIFVVTGEPGSGKSALLAAFSRVLESRLSNNTLLFTHFIGATPGSTDLRRMLRRLCHALAPAELVPEDLDELVSKSHVLLMNTSQQVVLVFDGLNQLDRTDGAHYLWWLPTALPARVRVVASTPPHVILETLRSRGASVQTLSPLSEPDAHAIVYAFFRRYGKRLDSFQLELLLRKTEARLPLYLLMAVEELRTLGAYDEITARIFELPDTVRWLFTWILKKRLPQDLSVSIRGGYDCAERMVQHFARFMSVSRRGLSVAELCALLAPAESPEGVDDANGEVAVLLRWLRPYLMWRDELVDFFHIQLREAVEAEYLDTPEKRVTANSRVASQLQSDADPLGDGSYGGSSTHALQELAYHQTAAGAWDQVAETLQNLFFLEAKIIAGMAYDLVGDFTFSLDNLPNDHPEKPILRLLQEGARLKVDFLARHAHDYPQALFQCLWNSGWWYDCGLASEHYASAVDHSEVTSRRLCHVLERWRVEREAAVPGFPWMRSIRPPEMPLGSPLHLCLRGGGTTLHFSPDSRRIASAGNEIVYVWDGRTGAQLAALHGHQWEVDTVRFSPDGKMIASAGEDETVRLWDAETYAPIAILRGHSDWVRSVAFSPNGERLASAGNADKTIRLWDIRQRQELRVFEMDRWAFGVCFSPDGSIIAAAAGDRVCLLDAGSLVPIGVLDFPTGCECVCFSPDGKYIVAGGSSSGDDKLLVRIWDARTYSELATSPEHQFTHLAVSPDSQRIATASSDGIHVWGIQDGSEIGIFQHPGGELEVAFSPDGRWIAAAGGSVWVWDVEQKWQFPALRGHRDYVNDVRFSHDGRYLATASSDGTVRLWDPHQGLEIAVLSGHTDSVAALTFSADGTRIASASHDTTVRIWAVEPPRELAALRSKSIVKPRAPPFYSEWMTSVRFTPDGARVFAGTTKGTVCVWDAFTGNEVALWNGEERLVTCITVSPDGRRFARASQPQREGEAVIRVCDTVQGYDIIRLYGAKWVESVDFSPDGARIASCGLWQDPTVTVWETASGAMIERIVGESDVTAIASGATAFPFRLIVRGGTVIEHAGSGQAIAWLPGGLTQPGATHPCGRLWAGASGDYVGLFQLEGSPR